jgi:DNA sulfur modification protein DndB
MSGVALHSKFSEHILGGIEMRVSFPAMKGQIGQRTYYSCLMKLNAIPKMFTFRDWVEFTPEEREQRALNKKRIPAMAKYILDNEEGYILSSITASYRCALISLLLKERN